MKKLSDHSCKACSGKSEKLTGSEVQKYLAQVPKWKVSEEDNGKKIYRTFSFNDFEQTVKYLNRVAKVAEEEGHHPNLFLHDYNKLDIIIYTHKIGGLHLNDFILAQKIDNL